MIVHYLAQAKKLKDMTYTMNERKIEMDELIKQNKGQFTKLQFVSEKSVNIQRLLLITNDQTCNWSYNWSEKVLV